MASTDSRTSWTSKEHNDLAATVAASVNSDGTLSPAAVQTALGGSLPLNAADYGVLPGASDTAVVAGLNEALTVAAENMAAAGLGPYGGKVIVPAGAYDFNGLVDVLSGVDLVGMGTYATRFNATGADAQFRFGDGGGEHLASAPQLQDLAQQFPGHQGRRPGVEGGAERHPAAGFR